MELSPPPRRVTDAGISIDANVELANAPPSMYCNPSGNEILVSFAQINASASIPTTVYSVPSLVTVAGIVTSPE